MTMAATTISLLEADPDLTDHLPLEERSLAGRVQLPLRVVDAGEVDLRLLLGEAHTFTALVLDGMLLQTLRIGEHAALRLLGPGDLISLTRAPPSMLVLDAELRATVPTRLALLGSEFLVAGRRWPSLAVKLHARDTEQAERLLAQLVICQLPRVDERLLAMMWLLSETWGRVTTSGTVLTIRLTHGALGGLVGARRSTVTLALQELSKQGAIVRQRDGWLLLQPPAGPPAETEAVTEPRPVVPVPPPAERRAAVSEPRGEAERGRRSPVPGTAPAYAQLRQTVARLRAERLAASERVRKQLAHITASRRRVAGLRGGISRQRPLHRHTPPSRPRP